jgi:ribosomal protein S18 acetylase RimI-like enzyme
MKAVQSDILIRLMTIKDYEQVYELWKETEGIGLRKLDDDREGIDKFLHRNPKTCFAAESKGCIIGAVLCGHDGRRGFIYHLAVEKNNRMKSVGTALVRSAIEALNEQGIHKVSLVVFAANESAAAFWTAIGFTCRDDLIYFDKSLNANNDLQ